MVDVVVARHKDAGVQAHAAEALARVLGSAKYGVDDRGDLLGGLHQPVLAGDAGGDFEESVGDGETWEPHGWLPWRPEGSP